MGIFTKLVLLGEDPDITKHCLFGISHILESKISSEKYLAEVFKNGVIQFYLNKIYDKINENSEYTKVTLYAFLGILGNFTYSNSGYVKILIKLNSFTILLVMIKDYHDAGSTESSLLLQRTLSILSNIVLDQSEYTDYLIQQDIIDYLANILKRNGLHYTVASEILSFFISIQNFDDPTILLKLYNLEAVEFCIYYIKSNNFKCIVRALELIKFMIIFGYKMIDDGMQDENHILIQFIQKGGYDAVLNIPEVIKDKEDCRTHCFVLEDIMKKSIEKV